MKLFSLRMLSMAAFLSSVLVISVHSSAQAVQITGELSYEGRLVDFQNLGDVSIFLDFTPQTTTVSSGTDDYASYVGQTVQLYDFDSSPFTSPTKVWQIGTLSFYMTSLTTEHQDSTSLELTGSGYVTDSSGTFDDSSTIWAFTAQKTSSGARLVNFSVTSETLGSAVPEPSSLLLLGSGLLGLGWLRRRQKNS